MTVKAIEAAWRSEIETLLHVIAPRGKSLIMTVYGDAILPHGGGAWLGDLIELLAPLGLSQRTVRTSVYRLVQDDLLSARQVGRRSFYSLTETGTRQTVEASRRIYALRPQSWDGIWTQVWLPAADKDGKRARLALELGRSGFAALAPDIMLHLGTALPVALDAAARAGLEKAAAIMTSRVEGPYNAVKAHAASLWPIGVLASEYEAFATLATPIDRALSDGNRPHAQTCFLVRSLLIHAYRRILLRDPFLPRDLLPSDWPGLAATVLMARIHKTISGDAQAYAMSALQGLDGPYPPPSKAFEARFRA